MKRGGLGGAILLAAAGVAFLAIDRTRSSSRSPYRAPAAQPAEVPSLPPEPPDTATPTEPETKPGALLSGRVTDEEGRPIPGAEILLGDDVVARTGDDGRYSADAVKGADAFVGAAAKGFVPSDLYPIGDRLEFDFALRRGGGSLSLVLRRSAAEARVIIEPFFTDELDAEGLLSPVPGGRRVLNVSGSATVDGLMPEWSRVRVYARGYAPVFLPVRLHPGGPVEMNVPLMAGATLVGTVRTPDGAPVSDATVRSVVWGWTCSATADVKGVYRIEHLPTGTVEMEAEGALGIAWAALDLEEGAESRWDPVLRPPHVITGRVVEEDGSPVSGVRVTCAFVGIVDHFSTGAFETDRDGLFRVYPSRDNEVHRLSVWRPGAGSRVPAAEISARPSDSPVTITLPRGEGFVNGTVVDRNGGPAAGATIRVWRATRPDQELRGRAAADGSFRVGPLPPARYLVEIHLDGEPTLHIRPEVGVVAGGTLDLGVVRFPPGGRIRASVVDAPGVAPIQVQSIDGSITFAGEWEGNAFLTEELTPGVYLVRHGVLVEEAAVVAGAVVPVQLRLRPGATLSVTCVLSDGSRADATVRVETLKGLPVAEIITRAWLPEGEYRVAARDERGRSGDASVRIGREDQAVVLVLE